MFLDVENLVIEAQKAALGFRLEVLLDFAREIGILSFARGYADWSSATMSPFVQRFQSNAVQMDQLSTTRGKNTADLQLSLDALEMCLQPHAPDIVIVAGGDRDFVPLVQKLRRYGVRVVGVGVEGASSRCLAQVCDEYVYYDSLVRAEAEDDTSAASEPHKITKVDGPKDAAFNLLVRAIQAQEKAGQSVHGSGARTVMQRLDPTFDPGRLGYRAFKEFVLAAEAAGYVEVTQAQGSGDMRLSAKVAAAIAAPPPASEGPAKSLRYDSDTAALDSYNRILRESLKVPLIPWVEREELVRYLWDELNGAQEGLAIKEMKDRLQHHAEEKGYQQPARAIQKLIHTLSIAGCFSRTGKQGKDPDPGSNRFHAAVDANAAIKSLHTTCLAGILGADANAKPRPNAVAELFFGNRRKECVTEAQKLIAAATKKADQGKGAV